MGSTKNHPLISPMSLSYSSIEDILASQSLVELVKANFLSPARAQVALENLILRNLDASPPVSSTSKATTGLARKASLPPQHCQQQLHLLCQSSQQQQQAQGQQKQRQQHQVSGTLVEITSPWLRTLDLSSMRSASDVYLNCKRLQSVSLSSSQRLERVEVVNARALTTFALENCPSLTRVVVVTGGATIGLHTLALSLCTKLAHVFFGQQPAFEGDCGDNEDEFGHPPLDIDVDAAAEWLALDQLRVVDLSRCTQLSFESIFNIVKHAKHTLQELYLNGCDCLEDHHVIRILRKARSLQVLDLNDCSKLTNELFRWLMEEKSKGTDIALQRMTVVWNNGMSEQVRAKLRKEFPTLLLQIHYRTSNK